MLKIMKNLVFISIGYIINTYKDWILAIFVGLMLAWFAAQGF